MRPIPTVTMRSPILTSDEAPQGVLLIDKPGGMSSHAVVSRVRKALGIRKVGHAGTLDPAATGLLVVGAGRATRLLGYLTRSDKAYSAVIRLGVSTITDDAEGEIVRTSSCRGVGEADVRAALAAQVGTIEQRPSAVSAVKVDGKRAYDRVRAGEEVDLPARIVTIHEVVITGIRRSADDESIDVDIEVTCSAGTYIRAIARDAGESLGVGGHVVSLRRTASGDFSINEAVALSDIVEQPHLARESLMTLHDAATRSMSTLDLGGGEAQAVRHGRVIPWPASDSPPAAEPVALTHQGELLAIAEAKNGRTRYLAVFV